MPRAHGVYFPKAAVGLEEEEFTHVSTSWAEVEARILEPRSLVCACSPSLSGDSIHSGSVNGSLSSDSVSVAINTLKYMYFHMRCGIYVLFVGGRLALFAPFANPEYVNNFDMELVAADYAAHKAQTMHTRIEPLLPQRQWWTNAGGILCNVMPKDVWGQYMLQEHKAFLLEIAPHVQDCEFILNKRDHPQLRLDRREAYAHCFQDSPPPLLPAEYRGSMIRIMSGYTGPHFQDTPWPLPCDTRLLKGGLSQAAAPPTSWGLREPRAVFRGSATGAFPHNLRLDLCELSLAHPAHLDAGITSKNTRDRLVQTRVVCIPIPARLCKARLSLPEQASRFKYAVYVEGHSAASRYLELMLHHFVIIRVATRHAPADRLWYFDQLRAGVDHVCVSSDLTDLISTINWLRANDEQAERMARAALDMGRRICSLQHAYAIHALNTPQSG